MILLPVSGIYDYPLSDTVIPVLLKHKKITCYCYLENTET
jgi:hypothetical protein